MANDPRTVTVTHPDQGTKKVTPEVANALLSGSYGPWTRDGADQARIAELEAELAALKGDPTPNDPAAMPEKAGERIAWIGDDPDRAAQALADEQARGDNSRKTVTDHIESVLDPTPNDPAANGQED
jgi:hypothetical protein